jgi:hypothetical protein
MTGGDRGVLEVVLIDSIAFEMMGPASLEIAMVIDLDAVDLFVSACACG